MEDFIFCAVTAGQHTLIKTIVFIVNFKHIQDINQLF